MDATPSGQTYTCVCAQCGNTRDPPAPLRVHAMCHRDPWTHATRYCSTYCQSHHRRMYEAEIESSLIQPEFVEEKNRQGAW